MDLGDIPPADVFELKVDPETGTAVPKRVDARNRGFAARYFYALLEGFVARRGGKLYLFDEDNAHEGTVGMEGEHLVLRVLGIPVIRLTRQKLSVPRIEVGVPGDSSIELWDGKEKVRVGVENGRLLVRKGAERS